MPRIEKPAEPWRSFFADVDSRLGEDVQLHCCGGFVGTQFYGIAHTTSDVDFLGVVSFLVILGRRGDGDSVQVDFVCMASPEALRA